MLQYLWTKIMLICFLLYFFLSIYSFGQIDIIGHSDTDVVITNPYISQQKDSLAASRQQTGNGNLEISSVGGNFASSDFLIINKEITPNYKEYYLKNKINTIKAEIKGCSRSFNNILIKENIDSELRAFPNLHIYIEDPFKSKKHEIIELNVIDPKSDIFEQMSENYFIQNNTLYIKIPLLNSGENIKYEYGIQSNKSGIFEINTRLRLKDSLWPDLENTKRIEVRPPEVAVGIEVEKSYAIVGDNLSVTYDILHKSGWCKDPIYFNISFDKSTEYEIYYDSKKYNYENITLIFYPLEVTKHLIKVRYTAAGLHPIPNLNVEGAVVSHEKKDDIEVFPNDGIKRLMDNAVLFSVFTIWISIFTIILDIIMVRNEILDLIQKQGGSPLSIYHKFRKDFVIEIIIATILSLIWILIYFIFIYPFSYLLLISIPFIFFIILIFRYKFIEYKC